MKQFNSNAIHDELFKQIAEANKHIKQFEEISLNNRRLKKENEKWNKLRGKLESQVSRLNKEISEVQGRNEELVQIKIELESQVNRLNVEISEVHVRNEELGQIKSQLESQVNRLNVEISEVHVRNEELVQIKSELESQVNRLNEEISEVKGRNEELDQLKNELESQVSTLKEEISEVKGRNEDDRNINFELETKTVKLNEVVKSLKRKIETLIKSKPTLNYNFFSHERWIEKWMKLARTKDLELKEGKEKLENINRSNQDLLIKLNLEAIKIINLEHEIWKLTEKSSELEILIQDQNDKINNLENLNSDLEKSNHENIKLIEEQKLQISNLKKSNFKKPIYSFLFTFILTVFSVLLGLILVGTTAKYANHNIYAKKLKVKLHTPIIKKTKIKPTPKMVKSIPKIRPEKETKIIVIPKPRVIEKKLVKPKIVHPTPRIPLIKKPVIMVKPTIPRVVRSEEPSIDETKKIISKPLITNVDLLNSINSLITGFNANGELKIFNLASRNTIPVIIHNENGSNPIVLKSFIENCKSGKYPSFSEVVNITLNDDKTKIQKIEIR